MLLSLLRFFSLPVGNSSQYVLYAIVGSFENELSLVIKFAPSFVVELLSYDSFPSFCHNSSHEGNRGMGLMSNESKQL